MKKEMFFLTGIAGIISLFLSVSAISVNADYKHDYYAKVVKFKSFLIRNKTYTLYVIKILNKFNILH